MFDRVIVNDFMPIPGNVQYHDYWLGLIATMYNKIYFINKITVLYRRHDANASLSVSRNKIKYIYERILSHQATLKCFIERFSLKLSGTQLKMCNDIFQYQQRSINNEQIIKRIYFLIKYYVKIYQDQSIIKFLPRIVSYGIIISIFFGK